MGYWMSDFFSSFWFPLLFIGIAGFLLYRVKPGPGGSSHEILGVALGVVLGFVSQVTISTYDQFRKDQQLKRAAIKLLQQDAEGIYRIMWLYDGLLKLKRPETAGVESSVPPRLKMQYWDKLKQDQNFLLLAQDRRFAHIFRQFWEFETINELIDKAQTGDTNATRMAISIYQLAVKENNHRDLLLLFLSQNEIDELDRKHRERTSAKKQ